jgi:hypothetical protein
MPQSVEGKKKDKQQDFIDLFRSFCRDHFLQKSLRGQFIASSEGENGMLAYVYAKDAGLDYDGAVSFASYIAERHIVLKSMFGTKFGGDKMKKGIENLSSLLDADLDELRKSMADEEEDQEAGDNEQDDDQDDLLKSYQEDEESDDDSEDEESDDESSDDQSSDDEEDDDDSDDTEKSLKTDFAKSFTGQEENAEAVHLDVTGFIGNLIDEIGFHMDGFEKSMMTVTKQQNATVNVLSKLGELMKSMSDKLEDVSAENAELRKSLDGLLERPVGRKSVTSQREVQTLQKSLQAGGGQALSRKQVEEILEKSFDAGEIAGSEVIRFNSGVSLDALRLPASVKTKLGMQ